MYEFMNFIKISTSFCKHTYLDAIASVQMALSVTQSEFFEIETDDHYTCRIMVS